MVRKALHVGCLYNHSRRLPTLTGCANDALSYRNLCYHAGFSEDNTCVCIDRNGFPQATKKNIWQGLQWLIYGASPGDVFCFSFSGHGGRTNDGHDYVLTDDDDVIYGYELHRVLVDHLPGGAALTVFIDACHSASIMELGCWRIDGHCYDDRQFAAPSIFNFRAATKRPRRATSQLFPPPKNIDTKASTCTQEGFLKCAVQKVLRWWKNEKGTGEIFCISGSQDNGVSREYRASDGSDHGKMTYFLMQAFDRCGLNAEAVTIFSTAEHLVHHASVDQCLQLSYNGDRDNYHHRLLAAPQYCHASVGVENAVAEGSSDIHGKLPKSLESHGGKFQKRPIGSTFDIESNGHPAKRQRV